MDNGLTIKIFTKGKHLFTYRVNHSLRPLEWIPDALRTTEAYLKNVKLECKAKHPNDLDWVRSEFSIHLDVKMTRYFEFKKVQEKMTFCKLEDWGNFRSGMLVQKIDHAESADTSNFKNQITWKPTSLTKNTYLIIFAKD